LYVWQPWELQLLSVLKQDGISNPELAKRFGVPFNHLMHTLKIEKLRRHHNWKQEAARIDELIAKGYSVLEIADLMDIKCGSVYAALRHHSIERPRNRTTLAKGL
jgi:transposase